MLAGNPFLLNVVELRRCVGNQRVIAATAEFDDVSLPSARVTPASEVALNVTVEAVSGGLSVVGVVEAHWDGTCRRCLETMSGYLVVDVAETYEDRPTEGETYPISNDCIDLEPMARELLLLALPMSPLCSEECVGPDPSQFPVVVEAEADAMVRDPRWAALDELRTLAPSDE